MAGVAGRTISRCRFLLALAATATAGAGSPAFAQPVAGPVAARIAVVPFINISGNPADDWIGAGIAETLTADLEGAGLVVVRGLSVRPTSDPAAGANATEPLLQAGRALRAAWVAGGTFQRLADRIRVTTRLVDVEAGTVFYASSVDGALADLFDLQDAVSAGIRAGLDAGDAPTAALRPTAPAPEDPAATPRPGRGPIAGDAARATPRPDSPAPPSRPDAPPPRRSGAGGERSPLILIDGPPPPVAPETISRDDDGRATVRAVPIADPLRLDGILDEGVFETTPSFSGFIQQNPNEGAPATERTEAWVFYDDSNLYVAARLWDSAPESRWVANEMQRDSFQIINNDYFSVGLDTFYDRRNGFAFMVTPIGGFFDYEITDEGNPNNDWNPIWDSRTGRFDGGWTVEMEIPFKSLRFRPGSSQIWGLQLGRRIRWKNETAYLTGVPISAGPGMFRLSEAGTLTGVDVPAGNRRFEIKPYAIGSVDSNLTATPQIVNELDRNGGVDVKYGVTQNLTADFTLNTDFAQVEADEAQVNLSRFNLFFPEKREFFLEGRGIFDFGRPAGTRGGVFRATRLGGGFFGSSDTPQVFFSRRIGLNEEAQTVPIVGGGRLTGKAGPFTVGALNILTDDAPEADAVATNFTVLRIKRDILRRSRIGGIFTGRSVSTDGNGSNEAYGLDAAFSFYDNVNFYGYYARTRTPGLEGNDTSYQAAFNYGGDRYGLQVEHLLVGDDFNPEVGFKRRPDGFERTYAMARFSPRPASIRAVRKFTWEGSVDYIENAAGLLETRIRQAAFSTELENSDRVGIDLEQRYDYVPEAFEAARVVPIEPGHYDYRSIFASYSMGQQRRVSGTLSLWRGGYYNGEITSIGYRRGRIEVTPQFSLEPGVSINHITLPGDATYTAPLVTSRVTYTFTPRMFFGGLVQYSAVGNSLSANLRLRWEYRPGSEIFIVYNDQRDTSAFSLRDRHWPVLENRAFVVKFNRLFRF